MAIKKREKKESKDIKFLIKNRFWIKENKKKSFNKI
jgi:hypothetical protein